MSGGDWLAMVFALGGAAELLVPELMGTRRREPSHGSGWMAARPYAPSPVRDPRHRW